MSFLKIEGQSIALQQVIGYLHLFGKLRPFVESVVSQHVIYNEILSHQDLVISSAEFEQAIIDFRLQHNLSNSDRFQQWLSQEGMDYQMFQNRVVMAFKLERLKLKIAEPQINDYFAEHQVDYTQYDISGIVTGDRELAEKIRLQLIDSKISFDEVAKQYSLLGSSLINVLRGLTRLKQLPEEFQNVVKNSTVGDLVGPLDLSGGWCLFRIEAILPPHLEGQLKKELEEHLFSNWLADKIKKLNVELLPISNAIDGS